MVHIQHGEGLVSNGIVNQAIAHNLSKIAHPFQQPVGNPRGPTTAKRKLFSGFVGDLHLKDLGGPLDNLCQIILLIVFHVPRNSKASTQGIGQHTRSSRRPNQSERRKVQMDTPASLASANHNVDIKIFHGAVKHFLD